MGVYKQLTQGTRYQIYALKKTGHTNTEIAEVIGCHKSTISRERSRNRGERSTWFIYSIIATIIPFTSPKTSNVLRCLRALFGFTSISRRRFYTFMASPKLPWGKLWKRLWKMIPDPFTDGNLITVLNDFINPKTGRKIFACQHSSDHAAKLNQSRYPWSQNVVTVGLLKIIKGRWACLPLAFRFHHLKKDLDNKPPMSG